MAAWRPFCVKSKKPEFWVSDPDLLICPRFCYPDPYHPLRKTLLCRQFSALTQTMILKNTFLCVLFRSAVFVCQGWAFCVWIIGISDLVSFWIVFSISVLSCFGDKKTRFVAINDLLKLSLEANDKIPDSLPLSNKKPLA